MTEALLDERLDDTTIITYIDDEGAPDLRIYDQIVVSGGKDSLAYALHLLDLGMPSSKIELHRHLVDCHLRCATLDRDAGCTADSRAAPGNPSTPSCPAP